MDINFTEFFKNPNWMTAIVLIVFIVANVVMVLIQAQNHKKNGNKTVTAIDNLTSKIQILIDKEINTLTQLAQYPKKHTQNQHVTKLMVHYIF